MSGVPPVPTVVLIPTGSMEHAALGPALGRLFTHADFQVQPPERHLDGFTSGDVTARPNAAGVLRNEDKLAARLVASVDVPRPPDFACVVEDLELCNDAHPERVVEAFVDAVRRHLAHHPWSTASREQRARERLRDLCSFHIFRPMTEAYFFGDPAALTRAGAQRPAILPVHLDLEAFETCDQAFLDLPRDLRPKQQRRIKDRPERRRHPKSYLHYLCDPTLDDRNARYRETVGGAAALRELDWQSVLSTPPHCPFLHALLDDLAEALNHRPSTVDGRHAHPLLRFPGGEDSLLRNC